MSQNYDDVVRELKNHYINKGDRVLLKKTLGLLECQKEEIERLNSKIADMYKEMERIALATVAVDRCEKEPK